MSENINHKTGRPFGDPSGRVGVERRIQKSRPPSHLEPATGHGVQDEEAKGLEQFRASLEAHGPTIDTPLALGALSDSRESTAEEIRIALGGGFVLVDLERPNLARGVEGQWALTRFQFTTDQPRHYGGKSWFRMRMR